MALIGLLTAGVAGWCLRQGRSKAEAKAGEILRSAQGAVKVVRQQGAEEIRRAEAGEGVGTLAEESERAKKATDRWRR